MARTGKCDDPFCSGGAIQPRPNTSTPLTRVWCHQDSRVVRRQLFRVAPRGGRVYVEQPILRKMNNAQYVIQVFPISIESPTLLSGPSGKQPATGAKREC